MYGNLLNDDPRYTKRTNILLPNAEALVSLGLTWSGNEYILGIDYSKVSIKTWSTNIRRGWEWDDDHFGVNFVGHPYSGTYAYNAARSNGFDYASSSVFVFGSSLVVGIFWRKYSAFLQRYN